MQLNGNYYDGTGQTILDMVRQKQFREDRIVIEWNGEIIPRHRWHEVELGEQDCIEVVTFVGGG